MSPDLALDRAEHERLLRRDLEHRMANGLAMIGGLVSLEAASAREAETRECLARVSGRLTAFALLHRHLDGGGGDGAEWIDAGGYILALVRHLREAGIGRGEIALVADVAGGLLPADTCRLLGLAVHELVVNALKHAFPNGRCGQVRLALKRSPSGLVLTVEDDGVGLGAAFDQGRPGGTSLLSRLAARNGGALRWVRCRQGTTVRLDLPDSASRRGGVAPQVTTVSTTRLLTSNDSV